MPLNVWTALSGGEGVKKNNKKKGYAFLKKRQKKKKKCKKVGRGIYGLTPNGEKR